MDRLYKLMMRLTEPTTLVILGVVILGLINQSYGQVVVGGLLGFLKSGKEGPAE